MTPDTLSIGSGMTALRLRLRRKKPLFLTHTYGEWCAPGAVMRGRYRVTKVRRLRDTALLGGGVQPCWAVYVESLKGGFPTDAKEEK